MGKGLSHCFRKDIREKERVKKDMQRIMSVYGKFLLSAVVVLALLFILFAGMTDEEGNRGVFQMAGARLDTEQERIQQDGAFGVLETENGKAAPGIFLEGRTGFSVGSVVLTDYIKAEAYDGRNLPVQILRVENPSGQDITASLAASGEIIFAESGIYVVEVSSTDDGNRKTTAQIKLPVL